MKEISIRAFNPHAWGLFLQALFPNRIPDVPQLSFNPHAWGLFLQVGCCGKVWRAILYFQSPCLGTLFARWFPDGTCRIQRWETFNPHAWGLFLQVTMISTSWGIVTSSFQSPCLGTLFARTPNRRLRKRGIYILSIPMLGDSFCKWSPERFYRHMRHFFQSPCLGTLFARDKTASSPIYSKINTFNPHAWGLFLQVEEAWVGRGDGGLSIPMLGDSFCKQKTCSQGSLKDCSFNPHAWGLFLQGWYCQS